MQEIALKFIKIWSFFEALSRIVANGGQLGQRGDHAAQQRRRHHPKTGHGGLHHQSANLRQSLSSKNTTTRKKSPTIARQVLIFIERGKEGRVRARLEHVRQDASAEQPPQSVLVRRLQTIQGELPERHSRHAQPQRQKVASFPCSFIDSDFILVLFLLDPTEETLPCIRSGTRVCPIIDFHTCTKPMSAILSIFFFISR
jgi:hypothetical protein